MRTERPMAEQVNAMRQAFDLAFAQPPRLTPDTNDYLALRVGSDPYAVRLGHVAGVLLDRPVISVPTDTPALLGLAGYRGGLVPVFGLATLLGYGATSEPSRWLLLFGGAEPLGLAFDRLEGHLRLPSSALSQEPSSRAGPADASDVIRSGSEVRPVIDLLRLAAAIRRRDPPRASQEH